MRIKNSCMRNACHSKNIKFKHKTERARSRPNKVPKNEAIKNDEIVANLIMLKYNCKYRIKVVDLHSKS